MIDISEVKWWKIRKIQGKTVLLLSKSVVEEITQLIKKDPPTQDRSGFSLVLDDLGKELKD